MPAIVENAKFVFDTRNATGKLGKNSEKVQDFKFVLQCRGVKVLGHF